MEQKVYHYPVWIRIWHLINALICITLIITGINMQYSNPKNGLFDFEVAVTLHNVSGIILTFNYLFFFLGNILTRNIKYYSLDKKNIFKELKDQIEYYTKGIFKKGKAPFPVSQERKFNPLQKVSYLSIMYVIVPFIIITGWALLFPEIVIYKVFGVSGLLLTDLLHITLGFFVSVFLIIHVYFCTTGTKIGSIFKSMINGWSEVH
jgi:thiosulfate reductase cytochrome b subunit